MVCARAVTGSKCGEQLSAPPCGTMAGPWCRQLPDLCSIQGQTRYREGRQGPISSTSDALCINSVGKSIFGSYGDSGKSPPRPTFSACCNQIRCSWNSRYIPPTTNGPAMFPYLYHDKVHPRVGDREGLRWLMLITLVQPTPMSS